MPPLNLPVKIFNRPLKPVSLFVTTAMVVLLISGIIDMSILLGASRWGDALAVFAGVAAAAGIGGWWVRSQKLAEIALLMAFSAFAFRFFAIVLESHGNYGPIFQSAGLNLCWLGVAGGSWFLERVDRLGRT